MITMAKDQRVSFDNLAEKYKLDAKEIKKILVQSGIISARNKKADQQKAEKILDEYVWQTKTNTRMQKTTTTNHAIADIEWLKIVWYLAIAMLLMLLAFWVMTWVLLRNWWKYVDKKNIAKDAIDQEQVEPSWNNSNDDIPVYVTWTWLDIEDQTE